MKILKHLISTRAMAILLFLFAGAIGTATFIENSYNTTTARVIIYNSTWFELILLLLVINFSYNIKRYKLFSLKKWSMLTIHIGFITIILGAGISRYIGYEGIMIIGEGKSVNYIYSSKPYLQVKVAGANKQWNKQLNFTPITSNYFNYVLEYSENEKVKISYLDYIYRAQNKLIVDTINGKKILELILPGRKQIYIPERESVQLGMLSISFNSNEYANAIQFFDDGSGLEVFSPYDLLRVNMASLSVEDRENPMDIPRDTLHKDSLYRIAIKDIINLPGSQLVVKEVHNESNLILDSSDDEEKPDALKVKIIAAEDTAIAVIYGGEERRQEPTMVEVGGMFMQIGYGANKISLPFNIKLRDFRLMKYPGSESPSSFESDITIIDNRKGINKDYNIFMNHVVDYDGFRFFQSRYDWSSQELKDSGKDPDLTLLSVNHDFWGTWITYFGYLLLAIGFIGTLLNPNSRFLKVRKQIIKMRKKRISKSIVILPLLLGLNFNAQDYKPVSIEHADQFGRLLMQSVEGRIQPIHTLAYDIFHKVSKKDRFELKDGTKLDAMQVMVDFMLVPDFWSKEKIIYIKAGTGVSDSLGITGKYASLRDFFNEKGEEKLLTQLKISFNKKDANKNVFDKELIKVNERFNILLQLIDVNLLTIFPIENDPDDKWVNWQHEIANTSIGGENHGLKDITLSRILYSYLEEVTLAKESSDYSNASKMLKILTDFQQVKANKNLLPSSKKVDKEISYNKTNIFLSLKNNYGILAILLLIFSFIDALVANRSTWMFKILNIILWLLIVALALAFIYHTYGLALRWHITGHAPWSNGYEALTFIAWGGLLAGFIFIRNSKITLAATSLLAFFILMTAGHSSFDPQLTNLQPVLKSYWLMIHVACITISYGFLGLGFILGLINLFTYLGKTRSNAKRLNGVISELTYINEMTLTIGLILATIGTFLGGIWANESWGRYWGWDAKETWALVIVLTYAIILHFRLIPGMRGKYVFNVASVLGFSSVLMTFIGVNYYLSKGLHSYARGDTPVFPMWAWVTIGMVFLLIIGVGLKEKWLKENKSLKLKT